MPQPHHRARRTGTSHSRSPEIPSTLWATGPDPDQTTGRWPAPVVARAVREFTEPGDHVLLIPPHSPTSRGRLRLLPPGLVDAHTVIDNLDRHGHIDPPGRSDRTAPAGEPCGDVTLVLASLLDDDTGDPATTGHRIAELAATRLHGGGVLAVLTRATHTSDGALLDPTGAIVATAQAADLLFFQHIIAAPVTGDTIPTGPVPTDTPDHAPHHTVVHTDVLTFFQPRYQHPDHTSEAAA